MYSSTIFFIVPLFCMKQHSNSDEYIQLKPADKMQVNGFQVLTSASSLTALF